MTVFINPGHAPNGNPDPGATGFGLRECDVAKNISDLVEHYLVSAGVEVIGNLQSDSLSEIVNASNNSSADIFISIHCNAFNGSANGTETWYYYSSDNGKNLASCVHNQIVSSLPLNDRGVKGAKPGTNGLYVLTNTDAVSILVETAFIDNENDNALLKNNQDDFARAIARGVTDYISGGEPQEYNPPAKSSALGSEHFSAEEISCRCCGKGAEKVSPRLLELLEQLRANTGGLPLELSCAYRCPKHNAEVGGVENSQHILGTAADIRTPSHLTVGQLKWYAEQLPFDGIGVYDWGIHVDTRYGGVGERVTWEG